MPPVAVSLGRALRGGDPFAPEMLILFKHLVHPTRVNAVVGCNVGLHLSAPIPKPNIYSFVERELSFPHNLVLGRTAIG